MAEVSSVSDDKRAQAVDLVAAISRMDASSRTHPSKTNLVHAEVRADLVTELAELLAESGHEIVRAFSGDRKAAQAFMQDLHNLPLGADDVSVNSKAVATLADVHLLSVVFTDKNGPLSEQDTRATLLSRNVFRAATVLAVMEPTPRIFSGLEQAVRHDLVSRVRTAFSEHGPELVSGCQAETEMNTASALLGALAQVPAAVAAAQSTEAGRAALGAIWQISDARRQNLGPSWRRTGPVVYSTRAVELIYSIARNDVDARRGAIQPLAQVTLVKSLEQLLTTEATNVIEGFRNKESRPAVDFASLMQHAPTAQKALLGNPQALAVFAEVTALALQGPSRLDDQTVRLSSHALTAHGYARAIAAGDREVASVRGADNEPATFTRAVTRRLRPLLERQLNTFGNIVVEQLRKFPYLAGEIVEAFTTAPIEPGHPAKPLQPSTVKTLTDIALIAVAADRSRPSFRTVGDLPARAARISELVQFLQPPSDGAPEAPLETQMREQATKQLVDAMGRTPRDTVEEFSAGSRGLLASTVESIEQNEPVLEAIQNDTSARVALNGMLRASVRLDSPADTSVTLG